MSETTELKILSKINFFSGIRYPKPENYDNWGRYKKFLWFANTCLINITFLVEVCSLVIRICQSPDDLGILCACCVGAGYAINCILKMLIFRRNENLYSKLVDEIRDISAEFASNGIDDGYVAFHDSLYKKIVRIGVIKGGIELTATVTLFIIFITRSYTVGIPDDLVTPALSWTPYDNSYNPNYLLTCLFEFLVYTGTTLKNAGIELFFWLMLIVPTIQLRYLRVLLEKIMEEREGAESGDEMVPKTGRKSDFTWWIRQHQRVLGMIQEYKTITSPYLGVNYLTTLILLTLAGMVAISTTSWNIFQRIIINGIVISNTLQLYLISLAGDWVSESNYEAADGGLSVTLFSAGNDFMKDYLFVLARSKISLKIKFGGINQLCSENFEQLVRLTMTYLVTIVQLRTDPESY